MIYCIHKRYSKIDQHIAPHFKYNGAFLRVPLPFYAVKKLPIFYSMISTNQETGLLFYPTVKSVYPYSSSILEFLLYT